MAAAPPDRNDPAVRANLRLGAAQRTQRATRITAGLTLFALAAVGPFIAQPLTGDPGAIYGATIGSFLVLGCGVAAWPWAWSDAEREQHALAAIWNEARVDADAATPWTRYAAWAQAEGDRVDLVVLSRAGSAENKWVASAFSKVVTRSLDADAIADAATAMETLRDQAARQEDAARQRYVDKAAAAERKPLDDALRAVDESAAAEQRQAEKRMLQELAEQEAAEREAQAAAIARALRRP
jgi:hypothetical protein